jgi:hypothetical protein
MPEMIRKLQDVRVGDIFLGPIGGLVGLGVGLGEFLVDGGFRVGTVDVRHAGIVVTARPGTRYDDPAYPDGITDTFELAQAMPRGAEITTMTYAKHWTDRSLFARLPEDYPGQALDAAAVARLMVQEKVAYSFASYPALALRRWTGGWPWLDQWIDRTRPSVPFAFPSGAWADDPPAQFQNLPVEAICSVFVDQAWTLAGKQVMPEGTPSQVVTPSSLARALIQTDGVILGWSVSHPFTPEL